MIILIDNYDSFTFNLVHYLGGLGADVRVHRNDKISASEVVAARPGGDRAVARAVHAQRRRHLPRTHRQGGFKGDKAIPILGVCLGHQAIGQAFGGDVVRAPVPVHGKLSEMSHGGRGLFRGINGRFKATRYHSLVVDRKTLPASLEVTAETDDRLIMGLAHKELPVHGVQFHPESIASEHGHVLLKNFLDLAAEWNARTGRAAA